MKYVFGALLALSLLSLGCGDEPPLVDHSQGGTGGTVDGTGGSGGSGGGDGPRCGDSVRDSGEGCDADDFGQATCVSEGFDGGRLRCSRSCNILTTECTSAEKCDNDVDDDGDGLIDCADSDCAGKPPCPHCGDGFIGPDEACDGSNLGNATCESRGFDAGTLACTDQCSFDGSGCTRLERCDNGVDDDGDGLIDCDDPDCDRQYPCPWCGDGTRNAAEACDKDDLGGASCQSLDFDEGILTCNESCTLVLTDCRSYERCDNGTDDDSDGLVDCDDPDCSRDYACPTCGNGILQDGETCDGSVRTTCLALGFDAGELGCADCTLDTAGCRNFTCGDGLLEGSELCDDGNVDSGDGCSPDCHLEGDVCEAPFVLQLDATPGEWIWLGDTSPFYADYPDVCVQGLSSVDAVASFVAPASGTYYAEIKAEFDSLLFAWRGGCATGQPPIGCIDRTAAGFPETLEFDAVVGETVHIVVTAGPHAPAGASTGAFRLAVGAVACGDGKISGAEQCDDGNRVAGDGCDPLCRFEGDTCSEAYDINTNGFYASWVDFMVDYPDVGGIRRRHSQPPWIWATSTDQFTADYSGSCAPSTGRDGVAKFVAPRTGVYSFEVNVTSDSVFYIWDGACGQGAPVLACLATPVRPFLDVYPHGSIDWPGREIELTLTAGQVLYLVIDGSSTASGPSLFAALTIYEHLRDCGNGVVSFREGCDDGNLLSGDGCSAECALELTEVISTSLPIGIKGNGHLIPAYSVLPPPNTTDIWSFQAIAGASYVISTSTSHTLDGTCVPATIDTTLRILNAAGAELAFNDDIDPATPCSRIEWSAPSSGTYSIEVGLGSDRVYSIGPYPMRDQTRIYFVEVVTVP